MAVTITVAQLAVALRLATAEDATLAAGVSANLTRHLATATSLVLKVAPLAPNAVQNEAVTRIVAFLYDAPPAALRSTNVLRQSGAQGLLADWRSHRLARPSGDASETPSAPGSGVDEAAVNALIVAALAAYEPEDATARAGVTALQENVDTVAMAAMAAQNTADAATTPAEVDAKIATVRQVPATGAQDVGRVLGVGSDHTPFWDRALDVVLRALGTLTGKGGRYLRLGGDLASLDLVSLPETATYLDGGDLAWQDRTYAVRAMVTHGGATYLCIAGTSGHARAETEPGVGSAWQTYWTLIGHATVNVGSTDATARTNAAAAQAKADENADRIAAVGHSVADAQAELDAIVTKTHGDVWADVPTSNLENHVNPGWAIASERDSDNEGGGGGSYTFPAQGNAEITSFSADADTNIIPTLIAPIGTDIRRYRIQHKRGGAVIATYPGAGQLFHAFYADSTYGLTWYGLQDSNADDVMVGARRGDVFQVQQVSEATSLVVGIEHLAAAVAARLLPALPAAGSRNGKAPRFDGDTLKWLAAEAGGGVTISDIDSNAATIAGTFVDIGGDFPEAAKYVVLAGTVRFDAATAVYGWRAFATRAQLRNQSIPAVAVGASSGGATQWEAEVVASATRKFVATLGLAADGSILMRNGHGQSHLVRYAGYVIS